MMTIIICCFLFDWFQGRFSSMSTTWRAVPTKAPPVVFYLFISVGLVSGWLALIDHFTIGFLIFFYRRPVVSLTQFLKWKEIWTSVRGTETSRLIQLKWFRRWAPVEEAYCRPNQITWLMDIKSKGHRPLWRVDVNVRQVSFRLHWIMAPATARVQCPTGYKGVTIVHTTR